MVRKITCGNSCMCVIFSEMIGSHEVWYAKGSIVRQITNQQKWMFEQFGINIFGRLEYSKRSCPFQRVQFRHDLSKETEWTNTR